MSVSFKNTIGLRLLRYIFGFYFAVAVIVTSFQLFSEYIHVKENVFEELSHLGNTLEDSLARSIWNYNFDQVSSILLGINKVEMVSGLKVTDLDGKEVSTVGYIGNDKSGIIKTTHQGKFGSGDVTKIEYSNSEGSKTLFEYKFPVLTTINEGETGTLLGYCFIYSDHNSIIDRVEYGFILIIVNSLIKTIALWFIFLFFAKRILSKPLGLLTEATQDLDPSHLNSFHHSQDLDTISKADTNDELNLLANSFLKMRQAIIDKIDVIEQQNANLEQRVEERTAKIKAVNEELKHLSLHDPLTELPNRALFKDRFETLLKMAQREHFCFSVAVIDCKNFKEINDSFGHQAGDLVLKTLAKRIAAAIRAGDTVARTGGDEFVVLLKGVNEFNYQKALTGIINSTYQPIVFEHQSIMAGINIGVAIYPSHSTDAETLYKNADLAMHQAKKINTELFLFHSDTCEDRQRQDTILSDLEGAIDRNELSLFYQPVIDTKTKKIKGVEALLRWLHPELGFISPEEFVAIAEGSNLIKKLTHWVVNQALVDGEYLAKQGFELTMAINISGRLINDITFPGNLSKILSQYGFPREKIILELTETSAMKNPVQALDILHKLKAEGVKLSIDDFGTGYSSFSYLTKLPVDELKIDRSFLCDFNDNSQLVIKAIIGLAHQLNLTVVAEGVESEQLVQIITTLGGDYMQGYYYSKALPVGELALWVTESPKLAL